MSQLETAQRHLTRALRRLESALERRLARPANGEAAPQADGGARRRSSVATSRSCATSATG